MVVMVVGPLFFLSQMDDKISPQKMDLVTSILAEQDSLEFSYRWVFHF